MNLEIIAVVVGLLVFIGVFLAAYAASMRVFSVDRVRQRERGSTPSWRSIPQYFAGLFRPLGEMIPRSPEEMSRQERRIAQAGIRRPDSAVLFHGIQAAMVPLFFLAFVLTGHAAHHRFLAAALSLFLGAVLPDLILSRLIASRKERIQLALPDALDLTVVCVEAGLGLDQSLLRVGRELALPHPDLSDELRLTNLEMNMGRSRADSLRNLGRRTEVDDLKALCAVPIQTDRFGTSVGQALRVYAESLRTRRRQRAEEKAAKLGVKMIPPLVLFIFPAVFVVIVGPAVIAIIRELLPMMPGK